MFRSFFPEPKLFFSSAGIWLLVGLLVWFTIGGPIKSAISIDRFLTPAICTPEQIAAANPAVDQPTTSGPAATGAPAAEPAAGAPGSTAATPGSAVDSSRSHKRAAAGCLGCLDDPRAADRSANCPD